MNAYRFIDLYGADKAKRVIDNVVCDADYYSEKTGSYYSYSGNMSGVVKISHLKKALNEYNALMSAKRSYEVRQKHWNASVNKDLMNDH